MKDGYIQFGADRMKLPIDRVREISFDTNSKIFGTITIDFTTLLGNSNETVQLILRLIAWYQVYFFGVGFLGLPNPFGSRGGGGGAARELFQAAQSGGKKE